MSEMVSYKTFMPENVPCPRKTITMGNRTGYQNHSRTFGKDEQ
jgi:hypothetical protein